MRSITPCLWFDTEAEEAATFYTSVFKNSRITDISYYGADAPRPAGLVLMVSFELDGSPFTALNGGPDIAFNQAISLQVPCDDQEEIDELWERLLDGGQAIECGWLTDRYGVAWQIFPKRLTELIQGDDKDKAYRAMQAMMTMVKIDLAEIERAAAG